MPYYIPPNATPTDLWSNYAKDVCSLAWGSIRRGEISIEAIAEKAGLALSTVERFLWRETWFPQDRTVSKIAEAIGIQVFFLPIGAPIPKGALRGDWRHVPKEKKKK